MCGRYFYRGYTLWKPSGYRYSYGLLRQTSHLNELAQRHNVSMAALALNFVVQNPYFDKVVIGVEKSFSVADEFASH